ncbi:MAG: ABC transporter permease [Candidatus Aminicenantes bacterium]|jgi:ABC-type transport system involved in multi-copper enzyme maturation permease subunit
MLKAVIKREFLDNLISFKFIACVLVVLVLVSVSTVVLIKDYRDRMEDYNTGLSLARKALTEIPVYSFLEVGIFKKPSPMSIFVSGIERQTGNSAFLTHREIPTTLKGGLVKNEFAPMFTFFDLSSVVVFVFTILAILLSYDAVSGEKEEGTLSLILSNSLPRYRFLLGKYIGALVSIFVPLTLCYTIGMLLVLFSRGVEKDADFFISMLFLFLFSLLYLSTILIISMAVSSRSRTSFNSLIFLLAFYLITVFLLPVSIHNFAAKSVLKKAKNYETNADSVIEERNKRIREAWNDIPVRRSWAAMMRRGEKFILKRINPQETLEFYKFFHEAREELMAEFAVRIHNLHDQDVQTAEKIYHIQDTILAFLPGSNFKHAAENIAGTDRKDYRRFFQQLIMYWHQYVQYLEDKDAFSLRYFYPYTEGFDAEELDFIQKLNRAQSWEARSKYNQELDRLNQKDFQHIQLNDMPVFRFRRPEVWEKIQVILFKLLVLIFLNLVFFVVAYYSFTGYDPRYDF